MKNYSMNFAIGSVLLLILSGISSSAQTVTLVAQGSSWKYLANGSNQGTAWRATSFNDASWSTGNAELGYGDGGEATVIPYGSSSSNKYITYYFRKSFSVSDASAITALTLYLKRDDGAVVYLNGTEIQRSNMPTGTISYTTKASSVISGTGETTFYSSSESPSNLLTGTNVIAVEVHQYNGSSPDLSFDLYLNATQAVSCGTPSGLSASGITSSSATLNWTSVSGAVSYNIQYRVAGTSSWTTTTSTSPSKSLTSLAASSNYEFQVQAVCSGASGSYSSAGTFTTLAASCGTPTGINASSITSSSATISWTAVGGAVSYTVRYRVSGTTSWTTTTTTTNSKTISSLASGTTYQYQVRTACSGINSSYSSTATFTTLSASCGTPTGLSANGITANSAALSWSSVGGALSYNYRYRITGTTNWTTNSTSNTSGSATGLASANVYEFQVQAQCSGNTGSYSSSTEFTTPASGSDTLINSNATGWKYLDNGSNQGTAWQSPAYNDAGWASGQAELGYGDGDEKTIVSYGPSSSNKYTTTYFRKTFNVNAPLAYSSLSMSVVRDDGIVVYLNGTEVYRNNMPTGTIAYNTFASSAISSSGESTWYTSSVSAALLVQGDNTLAVEIHQSDLSSSDISFNLRLYPGGNPALTRGPYLQRLRTNGITVRWKTDIASNSVVQYGTTTAYGNIETDATSATDHTVTLNGLSPGVKYYYSIGTTAYVLQGDSSNNFITAPVTGSSAPVRIWVTGDFGNGSASQRNVRDSYMNYTGAYNTNLWLWLGDNAYSNGTDAEYQNNVFNVYPNQLKRYPLFPSIGNHDYAQSGYQSTAALGTNFPYFNIFSVPQSGEAGGVASNTPKYYSYNYANIHFIALDSYGSLNTTSSPMYTWLTSDLAANTQRWTIVYFHHPPYSKGSHDSDVDIESKNIRANIIPLLESYHVDLVLCGHSHINERSYLIKGHFGLANTFTSGMKVSTATNAFTKTSPFNGTIYAVCGTSGENPGTTVSGYPMPCMYMNNTTNNCSMVIDVNGDDLACKFLTSTGSLADQFTITKTGARLAGRAEEEFFNAYYNPQEQTLFLEYFLEEEATLGLELYNLVGEQVIPLNSFGESNASGYYRKEYFLSRYNLANGIYLVRMVVNGKPYVKKIVISK